MQDTAIDLTKRNLKKRSILYIFKISIKRCLQIKVTVELRCPKNHLKDEAIGKKITKWWVEQNLGILVVINYELISISSTEDIKCFQQQTIHVSAL